jgi:hypothetical protein
MSREKCHRPEETILDLVDAEEEERLPPEP